MVADKGKARPGALVVLALLGLGISTHLAAFQLGVIGAPWEPFFGSGSREVLMSSLSRTLPVPDAVMGAGLYLADAILGTWLLLRPRELPRLAIALAVITSGGAAVGAFLVAYQVVAVHALCTLCLGSALISWLLAAGAITEARARGSESVDTGTPASTNQRLQTNKWR